MGQYINKNSKGENLPSNYRGKITALIADGATEVNGNQYLANMICVVDNMMFAAAGYMYSEHEYRAFAEHDGRPKTWLTHPQASELVD